MPASALRLIGLLAGLAAVSGRVVAADDTIKLGEIVALTGKDASIGQPSHNGKLLAIEHLNAAGGILGRKLELLTADTQSKPGEAATAVRKLITRDKAVAIVGEESSGRTLEAASFCQAQKVPLVASSATAAEVTQTGDYIFRVCFIDPFQGPVLARFARERLGAKRVAILSSASVAYSIGLAKYFKAAFTAAGGTAVAESRYAEGDKDFRAQLTVIKAAQPDVIFQPGFYAEGALICKQARDLGLTCPLLGGDAWEADGLMELGGAATEGVFLCSHYSLEDPSPRVRQFVESYNRRFGTTYAPDSNASLGYDAVLVLADAIRRAGSTDRAKIREALATTKDFDAVSGRITLDEHRDASKNAVILTVKNGKFKFVESIAP